MPDIIRCPYCIEEGDFKVMTVRAAGRWLYCANCGHTTLSDYPAFQCECQNCKDRNSPSSSSVSSA